MEQIPQLPSSSTRWILAGIFFFLMMLVYGHSLQNGFVRWDDGSLIYENAMIRGLSFTNLKQIFTTYDPELYIPLTFFSFQIDYLLAETNASMYHFTNLLLHTMNALLVSWLVFILIACRKEHNHIAAISIALFCGLLFAVHPLHTEAVAWASARKDVLSAMFFLTSVIGYLYYLSTSSGKRKLFYSISIAAFTLGLFSKVTVISLPIVLLLIDWWCGKRITKSTLSEKIPYFLLSIIFGIIALFGKTGASGLTSPIDLILMSAKGTVFYLQKLFIPIGLSPLYPYNGVISIASPDFFIPLLLLLVFVLLLIHLRKSKILIFASTFYILTLIPSLPNYAKASTVYIASDRYAYLPSIGIFLLIGIALGSFCAKSDDRRKKNINIIAVTVLLVLSFLSYKQSLIWKDSLSLFQHVLAHEPNSYVAHNNIGNTYRTQKKTSEAIASYEEALAIYTEMQRVREHDPSEPDPGLAQILSNLGSAYRDQKVFDASRTAYTKAFTADDQSVQALTGLGILHQLLRDLPAAESFFKQALDIEPNFVTARINLGAVYVHQGRIEEAITEYEQAIEQNPFYPQAYFNLGVALRKLERNREAKEAYEKAVELQPAFVAARINLGMLYAERKKFDDAIEQFQEALRYAPDNRRALSALQQLQALE